MKRTNPTIALFAWLTAAYAASFIGSQGAIQGLTGFYASLAKPAWTPPGWLFAPVWTVLYGLMGWAAWRVWWGERPSWRALALWWVQLALSALWPWLFFSMGKLGLAFGEVVAYWIALLATLLAFSGRDKRAAWMLFPALAWVGFAAILNLAIWRLNPAQPPTVAAPTAPLPAAP